MRHARDDVDGGGDDDDVDVDGGDDDDNGGTRATCHILHACVTCVVTHVTPQELPRGHAAAVLRGAGGVLDTGDGD